MKPLGIAFLLIFQLCASIEVSEIQSAPPIKIESIPSEVVRSHLKTLDGLTQFANVHPVNLEGGKIPFSESEYVGYVESVVESRVESISTSFFDMQGNKARPTSAPTNNKPKAATRNPTNFGKTHSRKPTRSPTYRPPTQTPTFYPTSNPTFNYPTYSPNSQLVQAGINYHGGDVMLGNVSIYCIWYGDWTGSLGSASGPQAKGIIEHFLNHLGGSPWMNIQTSYTGPGLSRVSNELNVAGSVSVPSMYPDMSDANKQALILYVLGLNVFPIDSNAIYLILPSQDHSDPDGSCTQYCGYHTYSFFNQMKIKWSYITNPSCPECSNGGCYYYSANTANNNADADAMVSVIAHELTEAITDPDVSSGWYDSQGYENADKCAWTYGDLIRGDNSYYNANMILGGKKYLVQQNWLNAGSGKCTTSYIEEYISDPPTLTPTQSPIPSNIIDCPHYTVTGTTSTTQNYATCPFTACGGTTYTIGVCSSTSSCSGDTYLRLFDSAATQLASNDDFCGRCSQMTYTPTWSGCQSVVVREGCYSDTSCEGTVRIGYE